MSKAEFTENVRKGDNAQSNLAPDMSFEMPVTTNSGSSNEVLQQAGILPSINIGDQSLTRASFNSNDSVIPPTASTSDVNSPTQIINGDGSITWQYSNGINVRQLTNKTVVWDYPNGTEIQQAANGSIFQKNSDGSVYIKNAADGSTYQRTANNATSIQYANGTRIQQNPDGSVMQTNPDQTTYQRLASGVQLWRQANGSVIQQNLDGSVTQTNSDGTTISRTANNQTNPNQAANQPIRFNDGSSLSYNAQAQLLTVDNGAGGIRQFHFDANGQVNMVRSLDGTIWSRTGQSTWQNNAGATWNGNVQGVDQQGNAYYQPINGSPFVLQRSGNVVSA